MKKALQLNLWMAVAPALLLAGVSQAQLPPPTPEALGKKAALAEKKARDEATAKAALARAQDRVAERYRAKRAVVAHQRVKGVNTEPIPESEATLEE